MLLAHLRGGCMAPVGALGQLRNRHLSLSAVVLSADGRQRLIAQRATATKNRDDAELLGRQVADDLLAQGAAELIQSTRTGLPA
jgi:hydroxymethylbilane synthase